jgi:hypothetical protein
MTRPAESPGRPLERHGNVSPREMTVHGAPAPGQNPAYRPAHSSRRNAARSARTQSAARAAAPMMPALLRCTAGTIGVVSLSSGRKLSDDFDTPPPTTNRSGLKRNSR